MLWGQTTCPCCAEVQGTPGHRGTAMEGKQTGQERTGEGHSIPLHPTTPPALHSPICHTETTSGNFRDAKLLGALSTERCFGAGLISLNSSQTFPKTQIHLLSSSSAALGEFLQVPVRRGLQALP